MGELGQQAVVVRHNSAERRFEAEVDGLRSEVTYEFREGTIVLTHTFVPPALRGRGLAEKLVRTALEHARAEKLRVIPACSYVARFVQGNPIYHSLLE